MYIIIRKATGNKLSVVFLLQKTGAGSFLALQFIWCRRVNPYLPEIRKERSEIMKERKEEPWKEEIKRWRAKGDDSDTFLPVIRLSAIREKEVRYSRRKVTNTEQAAELGRLLLDGADRECVVVCCMDTRMKPLSLERIAIGTISECPLNMREVFKYAVLSNAACLLVFHNHPSGEAEPSEEDIRLTRRMRKAGELMGIPLVDHIILGDREYVSFVERFGWMREREGLEEAEGKDPFSGRR